MQQTQTAKKRRRQPAAEKPVLENPNRDNRKTGIPDTERRTLTGLKPHKLPAPLTYQSPDGPTRFRTHNGKYSPATGRKICELLMQKKSLKAICEDPRMPHVRTIVRWLADPRRAAFREMYYYARRIQAEMYVDEIFEIADESANDWKPTYDKHGEINGHKPNNEAIQRSRVKIDTRKWYAAKMVPRLYGDKTQVELDVTGDLAELLKRASNKDEGLPPVIEHE